MKATPVFGASLEHIRPKSTLCVYSSVELEETVAETAEPNRIFCDTLGEGRPLVVVPWGPGSYGKLYRWALQPLATRTKVHFWDYRGCGKSSPAERYSMDDDCWDLISLIEGLQLEKPIVLGHSYGGMLALSLALERPDLVGGLILVNAMSDSSELKASRNRIREFLSPAKFVQWERLGMRCIAGEASDEEKLKYLETEARILVHDETHVVDLLRFLRINFEVLAQVQPSLQAFDLKDSVRKIQIPTLITAGSHDLIAQDAPKALHLKMPGSMFRRFEASAHLPFLEEPSRFHQLIGGWLDSLTSP